MRSFLRYVPWLLLHVKLISLPTCWAPMNPAEATRATWSYEGNGHGQLELVRPVQGLQPRRGRRVADIPADADEIGQEIVEIGRRDLGRPIGDAQGEFFRRPEVRSQASQKEKELNPLFHTRFD